MWRIDQHGRLRDAQDMPATVEDAVAEIRHLYQCIDERDAEIRRLREAQDDPGVIRLPKWTGYESTGNHA